MWIRIKILQIFFLAGSFFLLSGCDPMVRYHLTHPDKQAVSCPGNEEMRVRAIFVNQYVKDETEFYVGPNHRLFETTMDDVVIGLVSPPEYIDWIQFIVYCGESTRPYFATKKISVDDWMKVSEQDYYYYIKVPPVSE